MLFSTVLVFLLSETETELLFSETDDWLKLLLLFLETELLFSETDDWLKLLLELYGEMGDCVEEEMSSAEQELNSNDGENDGENDGNSEDGEIIE